MSRPELPGERTDAVVCGLRLQDGQPLRYKGRMNYQESGITPLLCDWEPGLSLAPLETHQILVFRVDLGPRRAVDRPELLSEWELLSPEEQARALRFVLPRDGRRYVLCRGSLRLLLAQLISISAEEVAFCFGPGWQAGAGGHRRTRSDATSALQCDALR